MKLLKFFECKANNLNILLKEFFKQSHLEKKIVDKGGWRTHLVCKTRWNSLKSVCENLIKGRILMKQIFFENKYKIKLEIKVLLFEIKIVVNFLAFK